MMPFSFSEFLHASLAALLFGSAAGFGYAVCRGFFSALLQIKSIWILEMQSRRFPSAPDFQGKVNFDSAAYQIFDFVYILLISFAFCLMQYIFLDGVFRLFFLTFSLVPFLFFRLYGMPAAEAMGKKILLSFLSFAAFPPALLTSCILRFFRNGAAFFAGKLKKPTVFCINLINSYIKRLTNGKKSDKIHLK